MMGYKYVYGGSMQGLGLCELSSGGVWGCTMWMDLCVGVVCCWCVGCPITVTPISWEIGVTVDDGV